MNATCSIGATRALRAAATGLVTATLLVGAVGTAQDASANPAPEPTWTLPLDPGVGHSPEQLEWLGLVVSPTSGTLYSLTSTWDVSKPYDRARHVVSISPAGALQRRMELPASTKATNLVISDNGAGLYVLLVRIDANGTVPGTALLDSYDPATLEPRRSLPVALPPRETPSALSLSPDGTRAWVVSDPWPVTHSTLQQVDLRTGAVLSTATLGVRAKEPQETPDGRYLFFAHPYHYEGRTLQRYDIRTGAIKRFKVDQDVETVILSPDGRTLYARSFKGVYAIDTRTLKVKRALLRQPDEGNAASVMTLSPNGRTLYTFRTPASLVLSHDTQAYDIAAVDARTLRILGMVRPAATTPVPFRDDVGGLAISPDGRTLYYSTEYRAYLVSGKLHQDPDAVFAVPTSQMGG